MTQFTDFGLAAPLLKALDQAGYTTPTPIQAQAIPPALEGRDILGLAQTGTGKTAAFCLPLLHRLSQDRARPRRTTCRALILTPTRELAGQIHESVRNYGRGLGLRSTIAVGGTPIRRQIRELEGGVDVFVATPGRLLDLVERRAVDLGAVEYLVLDEADQMMDLGFIHALRRIAALVPKQRQTLFFSATMPSEIESLGAKFLTDPVKVAVTPTAAPAERIDQRVIFIAQGDKQRSLEAVLRAPEVTRVLVFTRTKHGADKVVKGLARSGLQAAAIHGNKSQNQREAALRGFRQGKAPVLVATDIAARGLDIDAVSHVVNFDLPNVPEQYVHRIGRTARAGASGVAMSFCSGPERSHLKAIERLTRIPLSVDTPPQGIAEEPAPAPDRNAGKRQGGRPGGGRPGGRPGGRSGGRNRRSQGRGQAGGARASA